MGVGKGPDVGLPEAIAALFTWMGPILRLVVLIYFKLGKGWGLGPWYPQSSWGGKKGSSFFFYVDLFFSTLFSLFLLLCLGLLGVSVISPFGPLDCLFFVCYSNL